MAIMTSVPMDTKRVVIVGGGAAGLSAAYTLKKLGFSPVLLEAQDRVGGRLVGDSIDGFSIDTGADFFCSSYDTTLRLCEELGLPTVRSKMKLGWFRHGRWTTTTPGLSFGNLLRNLPAARALGFLSPRAMLPNAKLFRGLFRQSQYLSFAGGSRLAELDGEETFGQHLERLGVTEDLQVVFKGFLEMTMGHVEFSGEAYMRTYIREMLLNADKLYVPELGAAALSRALADACGDAIRVSTPVNSLVIHDGAVTAVAVDGDTIEADAVICAPPPKDPRDRPGPAQLGPSDTEQHHLLFGVPGGDRPGPPAPSPGLARRAVPRGRHSPPFGQVHQPARLRS